MYKFSLKIKMNFYSVFVKRLPMFLMLMASYQTAYAVDSSEAYIEYAYPLKISLDVEKLEGFVFYNICRRDKVENKSICKKQRLPITPQTKAYANNEQVPLRQAKNRIGKYAAIVYDKNTLIIKAISW